jgi:hypothetical protein
MFLFSCKSSTNGIDKKKFSFAKKRDTIRIANDSLEYEIVIIDPGFSSWFMSQAQPRHFYNQNYLESRNRFWVQEWNNRALMPTQYNSQLYQMPIDYQSSINYGYEVNYMLFNYLTYFQLTTRQRMGVFMPRI